MLVVLCIFWGMVPLIVGVIFLSALSLFELYRMNRMGPWFFFLGFIVVLVFLAATILIRMMPRGEWWIFLSVLLTSCSDIGAYVLGRGFGRHKLALKISPGKTVEGALGGLFCAVLVSIFMGQKLAIPFEHRITLGFSLGVAAMAGDLFESFLKRRAGVKDSGILVLGHGGILDRIDSHLFSLPVLYLYLHLFGLN